MKPKAGQIVECSFLDHCEDHTEPIEFTVWGRIERVGKKHLVILAWTYTNKTEEDKNDLNQKRWVIVRSAITGLHQLAYHEHGA